MRGHDGEGGKGGRGGAARSGKGRSAGSSGQEPASSLITLMRGRVRALQVNSSPDGSGGATGEGGREGGRGGGRAALLHSTAPLTSHRAASAQHLSPATG